MTTEKTPEQIAATLESQGWSIASTLESDPTAYRKPSDWRVTLTRNGQSMVTEYHKGSAHRRFKSRGKCSMGNRYGYPHPLKVLFGDGFKPGATVPYLQPATMTVAMAECLESCTEPEPPTIDEVLWSLTLDASGVRHGQDFGDWCSECGMDTDSRKAEAMYRACIDSWRKLASLGADFDALDEMFQDY